MAIDDVNARIGARLQDLRLMRGLTLERVARELSISYQQIRKYESGRNRVSVATLLALVAVLDVDLTTFFQGIDANLETARTVADDGLDDIADPEVRRHLRALIDVLREKSRTGG